MATQHWYVRHAVADGGLSYERHMDVETAAMRAAELEFQSGAVSLLQMWTFESGEPAHYSHDLARTVTILEDRLWVDGTYKVRHDDGRESLVDASSLEP